MKRILIVCGCDSSKTPVVNAYIAHLNAKGVSFDFVEYNLISRLRFVLTTTLLCWRSKYTKVVLINPQALVFVPLFRLMNIGIIYWKLEMTFPFRDFTFVNNLGLLEYLIKDNASLIVSNPERLENQRPNFKSSFVIYNAPYRSFIDKVKFRGESVINIVLYGNLDRNENLFLDEWIDVAINNKDCIRLTVIGTARSLPDCIVSLGKLSYSQLIQHLIDSAYDYSIVGYEPKSLNTLYAAPNKLIESMALGMGIIVNDSNKSCVRIVEEGDCGFALDFHALDRKSILTGCQHVKDHKNNAHSFSASLLLERSIRESSLND